MFPEGNSEFLEIAADKIESLNYYNITYPFFGYKLLYCNFTKKGSTIDVFLGVLCTYLERLIYPAGNYMFKQ